MSRFNPAPAIITALSSLWDRLNTIDLVLFVDSALAQPLGSSLRCPRCCSCACPAA